MDCTFRVGFRSLMNNISCTKQSSLFLHFFRTTKRLSKSSGTLYKRPSPPKILAYINDFQLFANSYNPTRWFKQIKRTVSFDVTMIDFIQTNNLLRYTILTYSTVVTQRSTINDQLSHSKYAECSIKVPMYLN